MCHIGTGPGPRPAIPAQLRRLVRLGETALAEEDIEHYDGTVVKRAIEGARAAGHLGPEIRSATRAA